MVRWRKEDEILGEEEGKMEFVRCLKKIKRELQRVSQGRTSDREEEISKEKKKGKGKKARNSLRGVPKIENKKKKQRVNRGRREVRNQGRSKEVSVLEYKKTEAEREEITVTYTDLLQPKAMRQSELWSRCNSSFVHF